MLRCQLCNVNIGYVLKTLKTGSNGRVNSKQMSKTGSCMFLHLHWGNYEQNSKQTNRIVMKMKHKEAKKNSPNDGGIQQTGGFL